VAGLPRRGGKGGDYHRRPRGPGGGYQAGIKEGGGRGGHVCRVVMVLARIVYGLSALEGARRAMSSRP